MTNRVFRLEPHCGRTASMFQEFHDLKPVISVFRIHWDANGEKTEGYEPIEIWQP